jgi:MFS family permease
LVALVQTASALPVLILGVPAGALADLTHRRRLLLVTEGLMLAAAAALAIMTWASSVTPAALLALTFALGAGSAMNGPAWQAIQPELVPAQDFPQAVTLGTASMNLGRAIGPALAGVIIAATGPRTHVFCHQDVSDREETGYPFRGRTAERMGTCALRLVTMVRPSLMSMPWCAPLRWRSSASAHGSQSRSAD